MNPDRIMTCRIMLQCKGIPADDWLDEDLIKLITMAEDFSTTYEAWIEFTTSLEERNLLPKHHTFIP